MKGEDIRWKQRFRNFNKSLELLESALNIEQPDVVQKAGIVQFFKMCCELSWKVMKDYLEEQGFPEIGTPRNAIKKSFEIGLVEDGHAWMDLLVDRNLSVHTYDEEKANSLDLLIRTKYFPLFHRLLKDIQTDSKN
jgi:nucleotidyltransferase substrate binding protein (TIGR01987 family)